MSLFGSLRQEFKAGSITLANPLLSSWFGGGASKSGVPVNWLSALKTSTGLACTRRIAEGVSTVPVKLYRAPPGTKSRTEATDHPLYGLLDSGPNEWQDSLQFREMLAIHAVLASNAYAFINRIRGKIVELIPLIPTNVLPRQRTDWSVEYLVTAPDGSQETLGQEQILHIRGLSWDGYRGLDTVQLCKEAIGLSLASEQTLSMFHAHAARPAGIVSVNKNLGETELVRLAAWVRRHYSGLDHASRVMVLDNDAKFSPFDMKGVDAQHVQVRQHEVEEVCRGFGVMPMVIGHPAEMAARAAVEQIMLIHLVHTVRPWHRRFEKAMDRQLLTAQERKDGYYFKFIDGEFLRAAHKDRAEYNKIALGGGGNPGWATQNEVRAWDELDRIEGGDHLYAPVNVGPIGPDGIPQTQAPEPASPAPPVTVVDDAAAEAGDKHFEAMIETKIQSAVSAFSEAVRNTPAPVVNVTVAPSPKGKEVTRVTRHDEKGRIMEFEREEVES